MGLRFEHEFICVSHVCRLVLILHTTAKSTHVSATVHALRSGEEFYTHVLMFLFGKVWISKCFGFTGLRGAELVR